MTTSPPRTSVVATTPPPGLNDAIRAWNQMNPTKFMNLLPEYEAFSAELDRKIALLNLPSNGYVPCIPDSYDDDEVDFLQYDDEEYGTCRVLNNTEVEYMDLTSDTDDDEELLAIATTSSAPARLK